MGVGEANSGKEEEDRSKGNLSCVQGDQRWSGSSSVEGSGQDEGGPGLPAESPVGSVKQV